jgi:hypothetical protein
MNIIRNIAKFYFDFRSWKSNEKLLVIESDDWGTERTPELKILKKLCDINKDVANDKMTLLDTIADSGDLSSLFEVLSSVKDSVGNPAVITANVCTGNPDFQKIKDSGFTNFFYEPFYETIQRKSEGEERLSLWHEGIKQSLFYPQLHGREHVHALAWLNELKLGNKELLAAFELGAWGIPYKPLGPKRRKNLMASLDIYGLEGEREFQEKWIYESAHIFKSYFGFQSETFIAPAYIWHKRIAEALIKAGIKGIQSIPIQYQPYTKPSNRLFKKVMHIQGQRLSDSSGLIKITRNAFFEPFIDHAQETGDITLRAIEKAFNKGIPAVVGSHRVNFIGQLESSNRDNSLKKLKNLLSTIVKKWPDVKFITSDQLVRRMMAGPYN